MHILCLYFVWQIYSPVTPGVGAFVVGGTSFLVATTGLVVAPRGIAVGLSAGAIVVGIIVVFSTFGPAGECGFVGGLGSSGFCVGWHSPV